MVVHTGTATDPLGLDDTDDLTVSAGGATGLSTISTTFFSNRIIWGNTIDDGSTQGPQATPDPYTAAGPHTFGTTMRMLRDARSTGIRVYKNPAGTGTIQVGLWDEDGTLLASKTASSAWVSDAGGWVTVMFDAPVELAEDGIYHWGYLYPTADQNFAHSIYVWNNSQDTCVYPMVQGGFHSSSTGAEGGHWMKSGGTLSVGLLPTDRRAHNFYVDPIVEWDVDLPTHELGDDYFSQFPNGGSRFDFPIGVYWADEPYLDDYMALGVNTLFAGSVSTHAEVVKAAGMDWYPTLHANDMSAPMAVQEDDELAECIRGYMITDEPEVNQPFNPPSTIRTWRNNARRIDSTRPMVLNLSRISMENQGFFWLPVGISAQDVNEEWREYLSLADVTMLDCYGIDHTEPFHVVPGDTNRFGIWIYPLIVHRVRNELDDRRTPFWGVVETTSAYADSPSADQVKRAVWSLLIAGVDGIEYFDHRFTSVQVSANFNAMIGSAMGTAISALNTQMQTLAGALLSPDLGYIESYTSTGTLAANQGGYKVGAKIPLHYSSRFHAGTYYFFVQSIRDGSAGSCTFTIPGFEGAVLTVIGESRTVTANGSGVVTDTFTGDYAYHLYSTTATPDFDAPVNTVAPAISGTTETGATVACSSGTWTAVPSATYTYQWQRDTGSGFANITGATSASYVLTLTDEGQDLRCRVTATNSEGSATASSNTISPTAPAPSAYEAAIIADAPVYYWRAHDYTDTSGNGHADLTVGSGSWSNTASLITDATDGSKYMDNSGTAYLSTPDVSDLRLGSTFSVEFWVNMDVAGAYTHVSKGGDFIVGTAGSPLKFRFTIKGTAGFSDDCNGTTTAVANTTYHVVATWDQATKIQKLYINGALETTYDGTGHGYTATASGWGPLVVGYNSTFGLTGLNGADVDELAIYDYVLNATQVSDHYDAGTA